MALPARRRSQKIPQAEIAILALPYVAEFIADRV